jgi:hypothetical protein
MSGLVAQFGKQNNDIFSSPPRDDGNKSSNSPKGLWNAICSLCSTWHNWRRALREAIWVPPPEELKDVLKESVISENEMLVSNRDRYHWIKRRRADDKDWLTPHGKIYSHVQEEEEISIKVLESFEGHVEKMEKGVAHVLLIDSQGRMASGEMDAADLLNRGIHDLDYFCMEISEHGDKIITTLSLVPEKELTKEDYARIQKQMDGVFGDCELGDI